MSDFNFQAFDSQRYAVTKMGEQYRKALIRRGYLQPTDRKKDQEYAVLSSIAGLQGHGVTQKQFRDELGKVMKAIQSFDPETSGYIDAEYRKKGASLSKIIDLLRRYNEDAEAYARWLSYEVDIRQNRGVSSGWTLLYPQVTATPDSPEVSEEREDYLD